MERGIQSRGRRGPVALSHVEGSRSSLRQGSKGVNDLIYEFPLLGLGTTHDTGKWDRRWYGDGENGLVL